MATWTTKDELNYLKTVGEHTTRVHQPRHRILAGYLRGMKHRKEWDSIDPDQAARCADDVSHFLIKFLIEPAKQPTRA